MGRNLSAGGMLVDPERDLREGDRLALALFGKPGRRLDVRARVVRNGEQGLALAFDPMPPEAVRELEALIASLPAIECSEDDESITVVTEITRRYRGVRGVPSL
jgi:hypothetical protein